MIGKNRDLVPTRITDKNGRRTTVHKKAEGKGWATGTTPAAPAARVASVPSPPTPTLSGLAALAAHADETTGYGLGHVAPIEGNTLDDLANDEYGTYPADVYDRPEWYGEGDDAEVRAALKAARGNPEALITVYRALDKAHDEIRPGDWVSLSRAYAEEHLEANVNEGHIISAVVPARTLVNEGNSLAEFGYVGDGAESLAVPASRVEGVLSLFEEKRDISEIDNAFDELSVEEKRELLRSDRLPGWYGESALADVELRDAVLMNPNLNLRHVFGTFSGKDLHNALAVVREARPEDLARVSRSTQREFYRHDGRILSSLTGEERDPNGQTYEESDASGWFDRDGYDLYGYDSHGRNSEGLTLEQTTFAAEYGIDTDLMRSLIDGD
jgi:hypothetical protein